MTQDKKSYTSADIEVREGLLHIRHRPAMYIGSVDETGLRFLLSDALDDFAKNGITDIQVSVENGVIDIQGQGRPPSVENHPKLQRSYLELVCTSIAAGGHFPFDCLVMFNALCQSLVVETTQANKIYRLIFKQGKRVGPLQAFDTTNDGPAIHISFKPDPEIFASASLSDAIAKEVLREVMAKKISCIDCGFEATYANIPAKCLGCGLEPFIRMPRSG